MVGTKNFKGTTFPYDPSFYTLNKVLNPLSNIIHLN